MKKIIIALTITTLFLSSSIAQQSGDPFNWTEPIVIPNSIYVLWSGGAYSDSLKSMLDVYFSATGGHTIHTLREDSLDLPVGGNHKLDLAVADLDNNGTDELIATWEGKDSSLMAYIIAPNLKMKIPVEGKLIQGFGEQHQNFVVPGDYDGDHQDEFVIAFIDENKKINLMLYDTDGTVNPELKSAVHDEDLSGNPLSSTRFQIISGDFNNDGDDEIAVLSYDEDNDPTFERGLYVKIYDVVGGVITPKVKNVVIPETVLTNSSEVQLNEIAIAASAVPGYGNQQDLIAIAVTSLHSDNPNVKDTYLQLVKTGSGLNSLIFDENKQQSKHYNSNYIPSVSLVAGDIDGDGASELIFARSGVFDIYLTDTDLNLTKENGGNVQTSNNGEDLHESYDFIQMCNMDDMPGEELVVLKNLYNKDIENPYPQGFSISVFGDTTETLNSFGLKSSAKELNEISNKWPIRTYALAVGDFGNSKVTIQAPRYSHRTAISQPIVVLNAPPVHFDVFGNDIYDINTCYTNASCDFISTYSKTVSSTSELTTEIKGSWDASGGVAREGSIGVGAEVSAEPFGVGASVSTTYSENFEYHLLLNYGEFFENTNTNIDKQTITLQVSAIEDDQIFSSITDYDIWEYPYFIGNSNEESGVIVTAKPTKSEARWFPSKSVSGYSYQPIHEPGNILSYFKYDSINKNPTIFQEIQPLSAISTPSVTLSANSSLHWELTKNNFSSNNAYEGIRFGLDAGAMGFGFKAAYNQSDSHIHNYTTSISDELKLTVDIGGIDRSIGPTEYRITPYAYWSKQGALVIDYSVEPEVDLQGGSTWWQEMYGNHSDPTMILPWRLDPEKGFAITSESKRQQTRDIVLSPTYLSPGDTAVITANIRNFSLLNTPTPVKAKFYYGDPSTDGVLISDVNGNSEFMTNGIVPSRGVKSISLVWVMPLDLTHSRLYMVLDPDNSIEEVHENNNVGWISLQGGDETDIIDYPAEASGGLKLYQNYPNPLNGTGNIDYFLNHRDVITLRVYDMTGKLLNSYEQGTVEPGVHSIEIDGRNFKAGVYYYILQGRVSGSKSQKMMVIH